MSKCGPSVGNASFDKSSLFVNCGPKKVDSLEIQAGSTLVCGQVVLYDAATKQVVDTAVGALAAPAPGQHFAINCHDVDAIAAADKTDFYTWAHDVDVDALTRCRIICSGESSNGRRDIDQVNWLPTDPTWRLDSFGPVNDHRCADTAFVALGLEAAQRRVADTGPALVVGFVTIHAADRHIFPIVPDSLGGIRRACTVVVEKEDNRVLQTPLLNEEINDPANVFVHPLDHCRVDFHLCDASLF